eukprot:7510366-Alexandrium_andersonii.AAC.1
MMGAIRTPPCCVSLTRIEPIAHHPREDQRRPRAEVDIPEAFGAWLVLELLQDRAELWKLSARR